jgi:hypothetical protein
MGPRGLPLYIPPMTMTYLSIGFLGGSFIAIWAMFLFWIFKL